MIKQWIVVTFAISILSISFSQTLPVKIRDAGLTTMATVCEISPDYGGCPPKPTK